MSNIHYMSGSSQASGIREDQDQPTIKLELKVLGGLECAFSNGRKLELARGNAPTLLSYLALTPDFPHRRERLLNLFWSSRSEDQARNSLRQALSAIRKALGDLADAIVVADRVSVTISSKLVKVDALSFQALSGEASLQSLRAACQLYQGEFMEGLVPRNPDLQQWLTQERSKYTRFFIAAAEELSRLYRAANRHSEAIAVAERLVELDPLSEAGWRELMQAFHSNGQSNHALKAYAKCETILSEALAVEPEHETVDLHNRIKREKSGRDRVPITQQPVEPPHPAQDSRARDESSAGNSILVLPFDNLSQNQDQEFLCDGITESLIYNLSLFRKLKVKSRNSSFVFKQNRDNLKQISDQLNVDYIVEGSIKTSETRIRVTVQVFETISNNQIWGNQYNAELTDLLELEESLCHTIAATITGQVEHNLQETIVLSAHRDLKSYELLLSGIYYYYKFTSGNMVIAKEKLLQCLEKDPENVRAHVFMFYCHSLEWRERWTADYPLSLSEAGKHSSRALELEANNALVQIQLAELLLLRRDYSNAVLHADRAIAINPNESECFATKAYILLMIGDLDGAVECTETCKSLDPYHPWIDWVHSEVHMLQEQYDEAIQILLDCQPLPVSMKAILAICYIESDQTKEAEATMQALLEEADETMKSKPKNKKEWYQYWYEIEPYQDSAHTDRQFASLLKAGICH